MNATSTLLIPCALAARVPTPSPEYVFGKCVLRFDSTSEENSRDRSSEYCRLAFVESPKGSGFGTRCSASPEAEGTNLRGAAFHACGNLDSYSCTTRAIIDS